MERDLLRVGREVEWFHPITGDSHGRATIVSVENNPTDRRPIIRTSRGTHAVECYEIRPLHECRVPRLRLSRYWALRDIGS